MFKYWTTVGCRLLNLKHRIQQRTIGASLTHRMSSEQNCREVSILKSR
jgi:hypothetical protein